MLGKIMAGVIGGILVAAFGVPFVGMVLASLGVSIEQYVIIVAIIFILATVIVAMLASRTAKAWRYVLVTSAAFSLGLSFAHLLSNTPATVDRGSTDFVSLMTFFFGVVLLLVGLLIGRDRITYGPNDHDSGPDHKVE